MSETQPGRHTDEQSPSRGRRSLIGSKIVNEIAGRYYSRILAGILLTAGDLPELGEDQPSASILPCMLRCSLPCSCLKQRLFRDPKGFNCAAAERTEC
jgi:hypothetical protein